MSYLSLASGLVKLAGLIMKWMERSRLISQGKKEQVNESLLEWESRVDRAASARRSVKRGPDELRDDPHRRD